MLDLGSFAMVVKSRSAPSFYRDVGWIQRIQYSLFDMFMYKLSSELEFGASYKPLGYY
jgi:hypothetical protein